MMRAAALLLFVLTSVAPAESPQDGVRAVLGEQERTWNQGDLIAFVKTYAADATFVGKEVTRGTAGLMQRYRRDYPTRERMGTLKFSDIEVKMLSPDVASVIGRFSLARSTAGGGPAQGIFTLLLRRTGPNWKIILDHTS